MGIAENWQEVERWLSADAPKVLARLPKGASATDLDYAEKFMRLALPQELRESLAIHDGNARTFGLYGPNESPLGELLSLHEIILAWRFLNKFARKKAESIKGVQRRWWHRKWLPVLGGNLDYHTCIDLDPAKGGKLGQMFEWAHDGGPIGVVVAPSYGKLFARFVRELKEGRYRYLKTSPWRHARLDRKEDQRVARMIEEVDQTVASPRWKEPFGIEGCDLISKISFLWLIAQDTRLSMLEPAKVEHWKKKYLALWDPYMNRVLGPNPRPSKRERRAKVVEEFDRLIPFCKSQGRKH